MSNVRSHEAAMDQIAQVSFLDPEQGCHALANVRAGSSRVALSLSLETNGDCEVFLSPELARELAQALQMAAVKAECEP